MGDLFGGWVKEWWVSAIMGVVYDNPQHTFQFLTKFPHNVAGFMRFSHVPVLPKNMWIGTSVTCVDDLWRIDHLRKLRGGKRFVSFEPVLEEIRNPDLFGIDWIIIGRETGNRKDKIVPDVGWITSISETASCENIPVYMKHNLRPIYPDYSELRQEFPEVK
jgi:protein gp37